MTKETLKRSREAGADSSDEEEIKSKNFQYE